MQDPGILAGPFRSQWCLCNASNLGVQNGSFAPLSHLVLLRRGKATAKHTLSQHPESTALHLSPLRLSPHLETLLARAALPSHTHVAGHVLQELGCNELTHLQPFQVGRQAVRRPPAHISLPFSPSDVMTPLRHPVFLASRSQTKQWAPAGALTPAALRTPVCGHCPPLVHLSSQWLCEEKAAKLPWSIIIMSLFWFHRTDIHISFLSLALDLTIHNKQKKKEKLVKLLNNDPSCAA
jgi:hypothetical protein